MTNRFVRLFVAPADCDRHNNINFIRFIAASAVIYGHMGHLIGAPIPLICGQAVSTIAVKVFFVLSGYLITQSYLRDGHPFRYLVRRVFRIFPGLIFVVLITTFVFGPLFSVLSPYEYLAHPQTWAYLLTGVLNPQFSLPGVFDDLPYPGVMNGSLWTLPVEFAMYLFLPLLLIPLKALRIEKPGVAIVAIGVGAVSLARVAGLIGGVRVIWGTNLVEAIVLVPYFFFGALAVYVKVQDKVNLQLAFALMLLLVSVHADADWKYELAVMLLLPYITLAWALVKPAFFGRVFAENDYSYGVYLWGFLIQQTLVRILGPDAMGLMTYSLVAFCCTLPFAMMSWFLVERPCSRVGKRLTSWSRAREHHGGA